MILPRKKYSDIGQNWELPENVDWLAIEEVVNAVKHGQQTQLRTMHWDTNTYSLTELSPSDMVIIEGFLLFHDTEIVTNLDLAVYVDVSDETGIARRLDRIDSNKDRILRKMVP